ncbi:hypothetical protein D3C80_1595530 [compost metagenome]
MPAEFVEFQLRTHFTAAIKDSQPLGAQHPFMAVGHGKVALVLLHIEGQGAQLLNGVDAKQHVAVLAALTQARQVQAQAAGKLYGTDGHQTRLWSARGQ